MSNIDCPKPKPACVHCKDTKELCGVTMTTYKDCDCGNCERGPSTRIPCSYCVEPIEPVELISHERIADLLATERRYRMLVERYQWKPISELHEDYGDCVLINIKTDTGHLAIGSNLDIGFDESKWTHFSRIVPLGQEEYERLKAQNGPGDAI